jgi:hypothetical protein
LNSSTTLLFPSWGNNAAVADGLHGGIGAAATAQVGHQCCVCSEQ